MSFSASTSRSDRQKGTCPQPSRLANRSSTLPSKRPFRNRTVSISLSTMIPALSRCRAPCCGWVSASTRPVARRSGGSGHRRAAHSRRSPRNRARGPNRLIDPAIGEADRTSASSAASSNGPAQAQAMTCWASTSSAPGRNVLAIALALVHRILGRHGFEEFEPVARHQQSAAGAIEPVVGAADALEQAARSLGRAHLHHQVDIAPVDPRSRLAVQTSARSSPRAMAPSTLRRPRRERSVVDADGQVSSFASHRCWKIYSARNRVLVKTSVVRFSRMRGRAAGSPRSRHGRPRARALPAAGSKLRLRAPGSPSTSATDRYRPHRGQPFAEGLADRPAWPTAPTRCMSAPAPAAALRDRASRSPRFWVAKACISSTPRASARQTGHALSG
jgi:hypothetical protein